MLFRFCKHYCNTAELFSLKLPSFDAVICYAKRSVVSQLHCANLQLVILIYSILFSIVFTVAFNRSSSLK